MGPFQKEWWWTHGNLLRFNTFADWLVSGTVLAIGGFISLGIILTAIVLFFRLLLRLWTTTGVI